MSKIHVESGEKYYHLTAIRFYGTDEKKRKLWLFECDCENHTQKVIRLAEVINGKTKSCGCGRYSSKNVKHNLSKSKIKNVYRHMIDRCYKENDKNYNRYGARGITVCDEWRKGVEYFAKWAFANGYQECLTLDRADNDKGYSPENCRWVSYKTQQNNRSDNHRLTFCGETHTLSEWEEITGIRQQCILSRIRAGWSTERALTQDVRKTNRKVRYAV